MDIIDFEIEDGRLIYHNCFSNEVTIPDGVTEIESRAFAHEKAVASVVIPESVTKIHSYAFGLGDELRKVVNLSKVSFFGDEAVIKTDKLVKLEAFFPNEPIERINKKLILTAIDNFFEQNGRYSDERKQAYTAYIKSHCRSLLSKAVTERRIKTVALLVQSGLMSDSAVDRAHELGDESIRELLSIARHPDFKYDSQKLSRFFYNIKDGVLLRHYNGEAITEVPEGVTEIADYAFADDYFIKKITLPQSLRKIGEGAFINCERLEYINISSEVTQICKKAFFYCSSLHQTIVPDGIKTLEKQIFAGCYRLKRVALPDGLETISEAAFDGCELLREIEIPDTVDYIGEGAFYGCNSLMSIRLPRSLKAVEETTFCCCMNLIEVIIPEGVTEIKRDAFSVCTRLESVVLPEGLSKIGESAFASCRSLKSVKLPESLKILGRAVFSNCECLEEICIPEGVEEIGGGLLWFCDGLKKLVNLSCVPALNGNVSIDDEQADGMEFFAPKVPIRCVYKRLELRAIEIFLSDKASFSPSQRRDYEQYIRLHSRVLLPQMVEKRKINLLIKCLEQGLGTTLGIEYAFEAARDDLEIKAMLLNYINKSSNGSAKRGGKNLIDMLDD